MHGSTKGPICPEMVIGEVVRSYPSTHRTFHEIGLHVCHFGGWTIEEACRYQQMPVDGVVERLNASAQSPETSEPDPTWHHHHGQ